MMPKKGEALSVRALSVPTVMMEIDWTRIDL